MLSNMFIQYIGSKIINEVITKSNVENHMISGIFYEKKYVTGFWSIIDIKKGIPLHRRGAAKSKHVHTSGLCFPSY